MKSMNMIKGLAVVLATVGVCLPQCAVAAQLPQGKPITDVALQDGGVMVGQVVDTAGVPQKDQPVSLLGGKQELGSAKTDANGYFAFSGLRGGTYQVVATEGHGAYRTWSPGTAPPNAQQGALVVAGQDVTRGQLGCLPCWMCNPLVVAGVIAAAVAIPVAISSSDRDRNPPPTPVTPSDID